MLDEAGRSAVEGGQVRTDLGHFPRRSRQRWMISLVGDMLPMGLNRILGETAAAPLIYTIFWRFIIEGPSAGDSVAQT